MTINLFINLSPLITVSWSLVVAVTTTDTATFEIILSIIVWEVVKKSPSLESARTTRGQTTLANWQRTLFMGYFGLDKSIYSPISWGSLLSRNTLTSSNDCFNKQSFLFGCCLIWMVKAHLILSFSLNTTNHEQLL